MKTHASLRRLGASALLAFAAALLPVQQSRADAVNDARTALVAGEFASTKTLLDPVLLAQPAHGEAALLRAIARAGLAVESRAPAFATKLGASSAVVDLGSDTFDIVFKNVLSYENTPPLPLTTGAYRWRLLGCVPTPMTNCLSVSGAVNCLPGCPCGGVLAPLASSHHYTTEPRNHHIVVRG